MTRPSDPDPAESPPDTAAPSDPATRVPDPGGSSGHVPFAEVADAAANRDALGSPGADADRERGAPKD